MPCSSNLLIFKTTATSHIYPLSLHDALPICVAFGEIHFAAVAGRNQRRTRVDVPVTVNAFDRRCRARLTVEKAVAVDVFDRKSTRLNSSHGYISYAVFCLKKKQQLDLQLTVI